MCVCSQIEELGSEGRVEEAQGMMKLVEQLKEEREQLSSTPSVSYKSVNCSVLTNLTFVSFCGVLDELQFQTGESFDSKLFLGNLRQLSDFLPYIPRLKPHLRVKAGGTYSVKNMCLTHDLPDMSFAKQIRNGADLYVQRHITH